MVEIAAEDDILTRIHALNVWKRGEERAPHKPLLILLALGRLAAGGKRLALFDDLRTPLTSLLEEFGPPRKSVHPEYPFFWLSRNFSSDDPRSSGLGTDL